MTDQTLEVVEIATGKVVHIVPHSETGSNVERLLRGLLNNVGRFDARLCRPIDLVRYPEQEGHTEDNRLDTDRFFARNRPTGELP